MSQLSDLESACPSLEVLVDGYRLRANNRGYEGNIRFWIAAYDLTNFLKTVGGVAESLIIGGNTVSRLIPLIHPYLDASWNCYADDIDAYPPEGAIATTDDTGGGIQFSDYFIDVHFSTPPYMVELGDYPCCQIDWDCGEERVTRPGSSYKFPSDGSRLSQNVGVPVKTIGFGLTMYRLPSVDIGLYESLIGSTNLTTFYGFSEGTVIYEGPKNQGQDIVAGQPVFNVRHQFMFRSIPHNEVMRPDGAGFEAPIESSISGSPTTGEEEDESDPAFILPENELNQLWGY